jgi:aminoglycoside phosphotransferase (APT) family kinase protein
MEQMLRTYVNSSRFREALTIPVSATIDLQPLAQGEYNINYIFNHPTTNKKLVLRLNTASQMKLNNQIEYEFKALELLKSTGRTPFPYFVDGTKELVPYGILAMEYLSGRALDYASDMDKAAAVFADIHSASISDTDFLIRPQGLEQTMMTECKAMADVFFDCDEGDKEAKSRIHALIEKQEAMLMNKEEYKTDYRIINTEVNSGNFIINNDINKCYLVDWEKPILGDVAQDLSHFLAPTTTYWKTVVILSKEQQKDFISSYCKAVDGRFSCANTEHQVNKYLPLNCLRGITWCAMAWVQYTQGSKEIINNTTFEKIKDYLKIDFLEMVGKRYFK